MSHQVSVNSRTTRFVDADVTMNPHSIPRGKQVRANFFRAWSLKAGGRLVALESELELRAFILLESDPTISEICEKPVRIDHVFGTGRSYTFDLGTRDKDGLECLIEVISVSGLKLSADGIMKPPHWDEITSWCKLNGRQCRLITDEDLLPHDQLINNWLRILPFIRNAEENPDPDIRLELCQLARAPEGISLTEAVASVGDASRQHIFAQVFWLIHRGELEGDLSNTPVDANLLIRVPTHDD